VLDLRDFQQATRLLYQLPAAAYAAGLQQQGKITTFGNVYTYGWLRAVCMSAPGLSAGGALRCCACPCNTEGWGMVYME
jgi:hypothetical protein